MSTWRLCQKKSNVVHIQKGSDPKKHANKRSKKSNQMSTVAFANVNQFFLSVYVCSRAACVWVWSERQTFPCALLEPFENHVIAKLKVANDHQRHLTVGTLYYTMLYYIYTYMYVNNIGKSEQKQNSATSRGCEFIHMIWHDLVTFILFLSISLVCKGRCLNKYKFKKRRQISRVTFTLLLLIPWVCDYEVSK